MIRRILCPKCGDDPLQEDEFYDGREFLGFAKMPANHGVVITGGDRPPQHITFDTFKCDTCNDALPDGSPIVLRTMWKHTEQEPEHWEWDYAERTTRIAWEIKRRRIDRVRKRL